MRVIYICGVDGSFGLPWLSPSAFPQDFVHFTLLTQNQIVVMGHRTWLSLPQPLRGRQNIVVAHGPVLGTPTMVVTSLAQAIADSKTYWPEKEVYVIGGRDLICAAAQDPSCTGLVVTKVLAPFRCDRIIDEARFMHLYQFDTCSDVFNDSTMGVRYQITTHKRRHDEQQYLDLLRFTASQGDPRIDRTLVGTRAVFGAPMRFRLTNNTMPLFLHKRIRFSNIAWELLFFLQGRTDTKWLSERGVRIWDQNTTREQLNGRGFYEYPAGEMGPGYGFQWRHFGGNYTPLSSDHADAGGVDQIALVEKLLEESSVDRRIVLMGWNPMMQHSMVLPPCHVYAQFLVDTEGGLTCMLVQRSGDLVLGVPYNVAQYALMTHMLAARSHGLGYTGRKLFAKELVHFIGDAHVYHNHQEFVQALNGYQPSTPFPTLRFKTLRRHIWEHTPMDFTLENYQPSSGQLPTATMAV